MLRARQQQLLSLRTVQFVANADGSWNADSTAVWDLLANEQRPYTWTSADAAGLPIFPGLVRYDEVAAGKIQHAFRFTLPQSRAACYSSASHWAANFQRSECAAHGHAPAPEIQL